MPEAPTSVYRVWIRGSRQEVWDEITRTDRPIAAFFNNRMDCERLEPGARLAMRTGDGKWTGVVGEIVEVVPLKRFAHTFKFTAYDDPECTVIYELEDKGEGVEFTLTIENIPEGTKTAKQMSKGGRMIINTLKRVIETGKPSVGIRMLYTLFKVLAPLSPKRCRSENWPLSAPSGRAAS